MTVQIRLFLAPLVFTASIASAQTNKIVFPQLLSPANVVLMTNAEFRCFSGAKIFFLNAGGYRWFYPGQVNSNVLITLHTSIAQLASQQQNLNNALSKSYSDYQIAHQAPAPIAEVDDVFERAKKELLACENSDDLSDTSERIKDTIDRSYSEIIDNSILNDATGTQINNLEIERDQEEVKILQFARDLAQKMEDEDQKKYETASNNYAAFNANPIEYLSAFKHQREPR